MNVGTRATTLILRAEADLEEAGAVLADAFLRTDPQEWIVLREKRAAALAGVSPVRGRPTPPSAGWASLYLMSLALSTRVNETHMLPGWAFARSGSL